ncbi:MAG: hypothetical protein VW268_00730 [Rhodospirillaceae bacterium]
MTLPEFKQQKPIHAEAIVLRHVSLPRSFGKWTSGPSHVMPFIVIRDRDFFNNVCRQLPYLLSTLNVELSDAFKEVEKFDEKVLADVDHRVARVLNYKLEKSPVVRVHLAIPQNNRDAPPGRCSLVPENLKKYLK